MYSDLLGKLYLHVNNNQNTLLLLGTEIQSLQTDFYLRDKSF